MSFSWFRSSHDEMLIKLFEIWKTMNTISGRSHLFWNKINTDYAYDHALEIWTLILLTEWRHEIEGREVQRNAFEDKIKQKNKAALNIKPDNLSQNIYRELDALLFEVYL